MPSEIGNPRWLFPLTKVAADKRYARPACPPEASFEHIGVDGTTDGGLKPFYGFKHVRTLTGAEGVEGEFVDGFFPVTFRTDDSEVAQGFVYRTCYSGEKSRIWLEYVRSATGETWKGPIDLIGEEFYTGGAIDVEVVGKFVWVFREGQEPFFFYYDELEADPFIRVITDTGSGASPSLRSEDRNIVANEIDDWRIEEETYASTGTDGILVAADRRSKITSTKVLALGGPGEDGVDAVKVFFLEWNNDSVSYLWPMRGLYDMFLSHAGDVPPAGSSATPTGRYWVKYGDLDPITYSVNPAPWNTTEVPQDVPPLGEASRHRWVEGYGAVRYQIVADPNPLFEIKVVVQFFDSRTGRKSNFSDAVGKVVRSYAGDSVTTAAGDGKIGCRDASGNALVFPMVEAVYDSDKWDTLFIWRSALNSNVLKLDNVIELSKYLTDNQEYDSDADGDRDTALPDPFKRAAYVFELTDAQLGSVQTLVNFEVSLEEMPTAGAVIFHEGTMFFGNTATLDVEQGTVGVVQWSDPYALSVESVSPSNLYYLQLPTDEVVRFEYLGPNVLGLSRQGLYLFRKETTFIKGFPLHVGYGAVHERAACPVGSMVYYMTEFGLKSVDASGNIRDVAVTDHVMLTEWRGSLSKVRQAYDATTGCVFVLRGNFREATLPLATEESEEGRLIVLWMNTSRMTEVHGVPFSHAIEGDIFEDVEDPTSQLQRRAVFLQESRNKSGIRTWHVWVADYRRETPQGYTLEKADAGSSDYWVMEEGFDGGDTIPVRDSFVADDRIGGMMVYVASGPKLGARSRVLHFDEGNGLVLQDPRALYGVEEGDVIVVNPMYFRWTGPQLGLQAADGTVFGFEDFFRQRRIHSLGCAFEGVDGGIEAAEGLVFNRYVAGVYEGGGTEPVERVVPMGTGDVPLESVVDGPSIIYAAFGGRAASGASKGIRGADLHPSVEVFTPGLTFTLLGVKVDGAIEGKDREGISVS